MITVGSLFAGIGGLELGLERTGGFKTVWQVEIDDYATQVLEKHWPNVRRWRDVRTFPCIATAMGPVCYPEQWKVDLICFGFPCQDISSAGKRVGITGSRSGLFHEAVRVAGLLKPRWLLVENVAALLHRGMGSVVEELASLGYVVEWHCIPAASVGAPHIRDRVFILCHSASDLRSASGNGRRESLDGTSPHIPDVTSIGCDTRCGIQNDKKKSQGWGGQPSGSSKVSDTNSEQRRAWRKRGLTGDSEGEAKQTRGSIVCNRNGKRPQIMQSICGNAREKLSAAFRANRIDDGGWWRAEPDVVRVAHGAPDRVDRIRCLGNAVVPQVAQWIGERILEAELAAKRISLRCEED